MDLNLNGSSITVDANNGRSIDIQIEDVDASDVLDHFRLEDVINHFGEGKILDIIGEDAVIKYFGIETA